MLPDLLFPNRCLECNRIIASHELVCEICYDQIHFTHHRFTESNGLKERCQLLFPLENAFALMQFEEEGLSRKIVHQLKYGRQEKVGAILAEWVAGRLDFSDELPGLMVPVPLHPKKMRQRGYNQLHLFTQTLSDKMGVPYDFNLIKRNFDQKAQATKDKYHRAETENIFSITKSVDDLHILIIDDVITTGNTMSSMAWEILKSGNNKVSILVMAMD